MATIVTRTTKGTPLTNAEVDANFTNINAELATKLSITSPDTLTGNLTATGNLSVGIAGAHSTDYGITINNGSYNGSDAFISFKNGAAVSELARINMNQDGLLNIGTVNASAFEFKTGNVNRWQITSAGHYLPYADNTYDIGASGATRPRNVYVGSNIVAGGYVGVTGAAGTYRLLQFYTGANLRWTFGALNGAESGANAGSNFALLAYDDTGTFLNTPLTIIRSTGAITTAGSLTLGGALLAQADNTYDIGASGANRVRSYYAGTSFIAPLGSASAPGFTFTGDSNTGMWSPSADVFAWSVGGNEAVRIDANSRMGIGTTTPSSYSFNSNAQLVVAGATHSGITIVAGVSSTASLAFSDGTSGTDKYDGLIQYDHSSGGMTFYTNGGVARWQISGSGHFQAGADATYDVGAVGARVRGFIGRNLDLSYSADGPTAILVNASTGASARAGLSLVNDGGSTAIVALNGSGTAPGVGFANALVVQGPYSAGVVINASHASGFIEFVTGGTSSGNKRWQISAAGHFLAVADNTYDIGAVTTNRVRNLYVASGVYTTNLNLVSGAGTTNYGGVTGVSDGIFRLLNAAGTGFTRLNFGPVNVSWVALKVNGAGLQVRKGDDSAMGSFEAAGADFYGNIRALTDAAAITLGAATDVLLYRDAANNPALRNGVNAQTLSIYNTWAAAGVDYERAFIRWSSNSMRIGTEAGGTGVARGWSLWTNGVSRWEMGGTSGHWLPSADATYDLGSTSQQVRDAFLSRYLKVAGALDIKEAAAPTAIADTVRLYAEDNGSGKTRLMALFPTGAAVQVAIEP